MSKSSRQKTNQQRIIELEQENHRLHYLIEMMLAPIWECPKCHYYSCQGYICFNCRYDPAYEKMSKYE